MIEKIPLKDIRITGDTQARAAIDEATVSDYAQALLRGDDLPPVDVFDDGSEVWLGDGFHRYHAHSRASQGSIDVIRHAGTRDDALWHGLGANRKHGLRMNQADKRRAMAKAIETRPEVSNRMIAAHIGVSDHTVAKVRDELESTAQIAQFSKRQGADGKIRPAASKASDPNVFDRVTHRAEAHDAETPDADAIKADDDDGAEDDSAPRPHANEGKDQPIPLAHDELGSPIHNGLLAGAFTTRATFDQIMQSLSALSRAVKELAGEHGGEYIPLQRIQADLKNAREGIKFARPYAVCPPAAMQTNPTYFKAGFVPKDHWQRLPSELKDESPI